MRPGGLPGIPAFAETIALATVLEQTREKVEVMTKALLEWETIDADQINDIMSGRPPRPPKPVAPKVPPSSDSGTRGPEPSTSPVETA